MRLDYDQLAECVDRLVGTTRPAREVAELVAGTGQEIDPRSLEKLETAAPACASCGVRGFGSEMVDLRQDAAGFYHRGCV